MTTTCNVQAPPWEERVATKLAKDREKIPEECRLSQSVIEEAEKRRNIADDFMDGLLDPESRKITNLEVPALMETTRDGLLSAVAVVNAFCKRAAFGHQLNKNLLEIGFERAIKRAEFLDEYWKTNKKPIGPLHGLPITMKDQYHVKGMNTNMGYVGWIDTQGGETDPQESGIVRDLESLGAVIIAKTTVPQTLGVSDLNTDTKLVGLFALEPTWVETNNNVLGHNSNPRNRLLSSGGSSGEIQGEGSVQALRGSAIGFGSDNGGSVSMPAAATGVYSIKPSVGRLPFRNVADSSPGQNNIVTVPGLLGSSVSSLRYVFKSLVDLEPWHHDPEVIPLPWRKENEVEKGMPLSFGFMGFDGIVHPHPPITRALTMVVGALGAFGHETVPWDPPSHLDAMEIHAELRDASGGYDVFERLALSGEPLIPELKNGFPDGKPNTPISAAQVEKAVLRLRKYRKDYLERWMSTATSTTTGRPVDALILPVMATAGIKPGGSFYSAYITVANVVDHTTMVIPVTRGNKKIDLFDKSYTPVNEKDKRVWESYDPEVYDGTPVAIQIQCGRLEEEKLLRIGQIVVDALAASTADC